MFFGMKPVIRSIIRASRPGKGKARQGGVKGAAKGAAKWAVKQGARKAVIMGAQAAIAAGWPFWAAAAAIALGLVLMLATLLLVIPSFGGGNEAAASAEYHGEEPVTHDHDHLQDPGPASAGGAAPSGSTPGEVCGNSCARVLTSDRDSSRVSENGYVGGSERHRRALEWWEDGLIGDVGEITHCPVAESDVDAVVTDRAWGDRRFSRTTENGVTTNWSRFHAGVDVFKKGGDTPRAAYVVAMTSGRLIPIGEDKPRGKRFSFYLRPSPAIAITEGKGGNLDIFYTHIDVNDRRRDLDEGADRTVAAGEVIGTISTTEAGGMTRTDPHAHMGFHRQGEVSDHVTRGRGVGAWDPWPTISRVCSLPAGGVT